LLKCKRWQVDSGNYEAYIMNYIMKQGVRFQGSMVYVSCLRHQ